MPTNSSALALWMPQVLALSGEELTINLPLHVVFGEAVDVARFFDHYWKSEKDKDGNVLRPGLDTVVDKKRGLTAKTGAEILSLQQAGQEAHTAYLLCVDTTARANPVERARYVLDEIIATLTWLFDDGVEDEKDARLASIQAAHVEDPESTDALAGELDDYATLASHHRDEMAGVGGFDPKLIDEARTLAGELRARPTIAAPLSAKARAALALRNKVLNLLLSRVTLVRAAARFVFRGTPEVVREVTSTYERKRRAASRRVAAKKGSPPAAPAAPPASSPS